MDVFDHVIQVPKQAVTIELLPLGCLHAETEGFDRPLFESAINRVKANPLARVVGCGDYFDFARSAYRRHLNSYQGDEDSRKSIDKSVTTQTGEFYDRYFRKIKGQILGFAEGNHHYTFPDGTTNTQLLCRLAEVPYLGVASWHRLFLRQGAHPVRTLSLFVHHGNWSQSAGGRTKGASRNAADVHAIGRLADIVIFAHDHKPDAWLDKWQTVSSHGPPKIKYRTRAFVRAGTFMEGEVQGCTTYVERALLRPETIGYVVLKLTFAQAYSAERYQQLKGTGKEKNSHCLPLDHRFAWDVVTGG